MHTYLYMMCMYTLTQITHHKYTTHCVWSARVRVRALSLSRTQTIPHTPTTLSRAHTHMCMYKCMYVYVRACVRACVCLCACVRASFSFVRRVSKPWLQSHLDFLTNK